MTKASSEPAAPAGSRIIAAESFDAAAPVELGELRGAHALPARKLTSRDLGNETARAAFALGRRRGWDQGWLAGHAEAVSLSQALLDAERERHARSTSASLARLLESFRADMSALESQVASDVVSLAIDIAREVLRREPATPESLLLPAAREALRALGEGAQRVEVQVHPGDAELLHRHLDAQHVDLVMREDPSLPAGSCQVRADTGVADASFEQRWHAVMATLGRDEEPLP